MNLLQAIVLGLIQGLTEFLPVSSSGHLEVFSKILGLNDVGAAFSAIIQIGTELAVIIYFFRDIVRILNAWGKSIPEFIGGAIKSKSTPQIKQLNPDAKMGWLIIIGTIPIVLAGVIFKDLIEGVFRTLWVTAIVLIVFGALLWFVDKTASDQRGLESITTRQAVFYGLAQCLALIPGVSRSGATMTMGRFMNFDRKSAAKFSFYLAIPSVFGAALLEIVSVVKHGEFGAADFPGWELTIIASIVSFIVGYIVIAAFMKIISKISYKPFAIYRIGFGIIILILLFTHVL